MEHLSRLGVFGLTLVIAASGYAWAEGKKGDIKASDAARVKVTEIHKSPASYLNEKVTVTGEVEDVQGNHSFTLDGEGYFNDEILVLRDPTAKDPKGFNVKEDDQLTVTGTLRKMNVIEIERDLSLDLDPQIETEFEGTRTVLVVGPNQVKRKS